MLQKVANSKFLAILGLSCALIFGSGLASDAQVRSEFVVNTLFTTSTQTPQVNQLILFEIDMRTFIFLNLHQTNIVAVGWDFGDGTVSRKTFLANEIHSYSQAGEYDVTLRVITSTAVFTATRTVTVVDDPFRPNPEQIIIVGVASFDFDGDNHLDDREFFAAIDAWVAGQISDRIFFTAVDIWVADDAIIGASSTASSGDSPEFRTEAVSTPSGYLFSTQGVNAEEIAVQIYNASGTPVFESKQDGQTLSWRGLDSSGAPVANGTYYYVISTTDAEGEVHVSAPQAIVVMR